MPGGRPTKLTPAITEAICEAIRTTAPMNWAARYAGVDDSTISKWKSTATKAQGKKPSERSQHERRCVEFFNALSDAEAKAFVFGTTVVANAARPTTLTRTVTTTKDGETTTIIEERQVGGEWRAMAHLMARRWPQDMGDRSTLEVQGPDGGPVRMVTTDEVWDELEAFRRARVAGAVEMPASTNGHTPALSSNGHGS